MSNLTELNNSLLCKKTIEKISVLIVEDQALQRQILEISLEPEADLEVIGVAGDGDTALKVCQQLKPDIVLMDLELPGMSGIEVTRQLSQSQPDAKVIVFTSHEAEEYIHQAFAAGAQKYLHKNISLQELTAAIRSVASNQVQLREGLLKPSTDKAGQEAISDDSHSIELNNDDQPTSTDIVLSTTKISDPKENDWSMATQDLLDSMPGTWTKGLFYLLMIFTAIIIPWSILAKVDETGMARGKLEPKAKTVNLDAPVAGKVADIKVEEGDQVTAQQILLELESDLIRSDLQQLEEKQTGQLNRLTQLELLQNQLSLALRTQQQQNQAQQLEKQSQVKQAKQHHQGLKDLSETQKAEKQAQLEQFKEAIKVSKAAHRLAEVALTGSQAKASRFKKAFEEGIISEDRYQDIRQQAKENQERLVQANSELEQSQFRFQEQQRNYDKLIQQTESEIQQANLRWQEQERSYQSVIHSGELALLKTEEQLKNLETQIGDLRSEIAQNKSQIASLNLQLTQRVMKSPINGTVFHVPISGAGSVVQAGDNIVEIAPHNSPLILKANMTPTESGFLRVGMPVKIKFDAYPFQDYGVQAGRVSWISPDSKIIETERGKQETYELEIQLERSYIKGDNKAIELTPGQTATAEIIIRQRRLIDFVLDPFKKLQEGGLEL